MSSALGCRDMSEAENAAQQNQELKIAPSSQDAATQLFGIIVLPGWCGFVWGIS